MSLSTEMTAEVVGKFARKAGDTGSPEVQVALLTKRIEELGSHFGTHIHDYSSKRGLMKMIGRRKALLRYLQGKNEESYKKLIQELGLRK